MEKNNAKSIKVVITGPESTGKTTLSKQLARHFKTSYVPEHARTYLEKTQGVYTEKDLLAIARGQIAAEDDLLKKNPELLICDTSLEVIRIWSEWKFKGCLNFILDQAKIRTPDMFLLLKPDLPWQPDPLRENPDDRKELYQYFSNTLKEYNVPIIEIGGRNEARMALSINALEEFINN